MVYYVSAHGYGHGVRSTDIIRALNRLCPELTVHVVTNLPSSFLLNRIDSGLNIFHGGAFDFGMAQLDSIRVDVEHSLAGIEAIYSKREDLIRQEMDFFLKNSIQLVVADIPAIPLEAAARAGLPGIAVGNFGWDWIYSQFAERDSRWTVMVDAIQQGYRSADLLLRLPFAEPMSVFRRIEDVPVVASPGRQRREEIAAMTGARLDRPWILLSFTTLDWDEEAQDRVENCRDHEFFTVLPLAWLRSNIHAIHREQVSFGDVVASVDAVISKPGFGIISDCVVSAKPLIYADRKDFKEYDVLVESIQKFLKNVHIPAGRLYQGELREALDQLVHAPEPLLKPAMGGAEFAARRMIQYLDCR